MEAQPRDVRRYATENGKVPFAEWLNSLRDINARAKIQARIKQIRLGNLGDYKSVGEGVCLPKNQLWTWVSSLFWTSRLNNSAAALWGR